VQEEIEIKNLIPGSVIETPEDLRKAYNLPKFVIFGGMEYTKGSKDEVYPYLRIPAKGQFLQYATPAISASHKWLVAPEKETNELLSNLRDKVKGEKLRLPFHSVFSGTDPEVFAVNGKGQVLPAWTFLMPKEKALKKAQGHYALPHTVATFVDGVQGEFCPPANECLETLHDGIQAGLKVILESARLVEPTARLTIQNTIALPVEFLKAATDEQIQFRCSPSYNIYRDPGEPTPNPRMYPYRFAGGHIHFGLKRNPSIPVISELIRGLDAILGVAGVSLAAGIDTAERRTMYGRAGEFRTPKHGIEYRVLSNFWLSHPAISHLVFELARVSVRVAYSGLFRTCWEHKEEETREVINSNNVSGARKILERNKHMLFCMLRDIWGVGEVTGVAMRTIMNGLDVAVTDPTDIHGNWRLEGEQKWITNGKFVGGSWASQASNPQGPARLVKAQNSNSIPSEG